MNRFNSNTSQTPLPLPQFKNYSLPLSLSHTPVLPHPRIKPHLSHQQEPKPRFRGGKAVEAQGSTTNEKNNTVKKLKKIKMKNKIM